MNDMNPNHAFAALSELCHSRDDRAALSVIERHVQDMEKALREIAETEVRYGRDGHGFAHHVYDAGGGWIGSAAPHLQRIARAALPAREKGTE